MVRYICGKFAQYYFLKDYKIPPKFLREDAHPVFRSPSQMSHIQSSLNPGFPVVDETTAGLSRLSSRESTTSSTTLVKSGNQGRQSLWFELVSSSYLCFSPVPYLRPGSLATFPRPLNLPTCQRRTTPTLHIPRSRSRICTYLLHFLVSVVIHHASLVAIVRYWWHW
jgi:hypothetical protein